MNRQLHMCMHGCVISVNVFTFPAYISQGLHPWSLAHSKWSGPDPRKKGSCHFRCIILHPHSQSPVQQLHFQWTQTRHYLWWCLDLIPYMDLQPTYLLSRQRDPPVWWRRCVSFPANQIPPKCTQQQRLLRSQVLVHSNRTNFWR